MKPMIFVNLPVDDLQRSMEFYTQIGFTNNPMFTDETAAAMVFSEEIYVMLLTHKKFKEFIDKGITDATKTASAIYALHLGSTEAMNEMADAAIAAGGREYSSPKDYGFMSQRSFEDPDGHLWEVFYMDITQFPQPVKEK
jgi:predicted lactoylglutathione lyase